MRDAAALDLQRCQRRQPRIDDVALDDDGLVAGASDGQRSGGSRDAASGTTSLIRRRYPPERAHCKRG